MLRTVDDRGRVILPLKHGTKVIVAQVNPDRYIIQVLEIPEESDLVASV